MVTAASWTNARLAERIYGPAPVLVVSEAGAAWLAAAIDGEGSIGIRRFRDPRNGSLRYRADVRVGNTSYAFIKRFEELVDGNCNVHPVRANQRRNPKHKLLFNARVNDRPTAEVLRQILPYLVIKNRQAEAVIELRELLENAPVRSKQHYARCEELYQTCKALNKRGT